jgi:hypothetical protein
LSLTSPIFIGQLLHEVLASSEGLDLFVRELKPLAALFVDTANAFVCEPAVPVALDSLGVVGRDQVKKLSTVGGLISNFGDPPVWSASAADLIGALSLDQIDVAAVR